MTHMQWWQSTAERKLRKALYTLPHHSWCPQTICMGERKKRSLKIYIQSMTAYTICDYNMKTFFKCTTLTYNFNHNLKMFHLFLINWTFLLILFNRMYTTGCLRKWERETESKIFLRWGITHLYTWVIWYHGWVSPNLEDLILKNVGGTKM